mmetsp:Transcript_64475/g.145497  ORF Transcript_64475/g.145497 Transcript_64475/m.145497 type:complete len:202 (+) Transcript_64475:123-728(+)
MGGLEVQQRCQGDRLEGEGARVTLVWRQGGLQGSWHEGAGGAQDLGRGQGRGQGRRGQAGSGAATAVDAGQGSPGPSREGPGRGCTADFQGGRRPQGSGALRLRGDCHAAAQGQSGCSRGDLQGRHSQGRCLACWRQLGRQQQQAAGKGDVHHRAEDGQCAKQGKGAAATAQGQAAAAGRGSRAAAGRRSRHRRAEAAGQD